MSSCLVVGIVSLLIGGVLGMLVMAIAFMAREEGRAR
jgi:hypothetical protein